ncbi:hypothetical protein CCUS01_14207 [Colletotrichum cuscutae]|uniref:Uncharacterized protein n=1 Tax=Colletotrichum cuscutae TaxID=1209917 RepID=A0AAJ0DLW1_9PEZI|nr:hypothetical protein CCUS01_14207 [Colletotrichum cuscutae]
MTLDSSQDTTARSTMPLAQTSIGENAAWSELAFYATSRKRAPQRGLRNKKQVHWKAKESFFTSWRSSGGPSELVPSSFLAFAQNITHNTFRQHTPFFKDHLGLSQAAAINQKSVK